MANPILIGAMPMFLFAFATLFPLPLLALAALQGGVWVLAALFYMTVFTYLLDQLVVIAQPQAADPAAEFPAADMLGVILAIGHLTLLALIVWTMGQRPLGLASTIGLVAAAGLYFGQVSNANAHELIHKGGRGLHRLGQWVYISMLYGHHTSAHVLIHHRLVATPDDPATARLGEGFWAYAPRAWIGAFRAGMQAETARLDRVGRSTWHHPYVTYLGGGAAMLVAAFAFGDWRGVAGYLALVAYAQVQLLLSDYVQHYGLMRKTAANGRLEPVGARHSWNAPHWFSGALMLNAPRHADHHAHPARPFPALHIDKASPTLPRSLPAMATLALFPPLWRRVMDRRVRRWTQA
ncbi:alkane 1-monooxygenase [Loktanella sp. R86503]|uniref:alkane 1-monooxygenase n=1 Tax=Loktanella sp. R86503 TaxID=3093847 RepID=UPI0036D9B6F6